ncbi:ATP-binding protein [Roseateles asaccharophilus]|uniref:histidine kinase n=1 Tax=Roseateles asaccharophilus TaxID=582607 RepID=A0ABU2A8B4_9BURK|nr:ATP-binding protein [Roseateles asaccharophilus]MDR7333422.1 signal transduction histidine kinase/CheY-like chemotaxis protein [Roseateles asaccharophilus]
MSKVLVVDDQVSNRELIVTLLKYAGHEPLEAADGHLALAQVREQHPDLVICDILMPTMDGYEFVRQLRADPAIAHTEVVFYTATFMEREARSLARSCGVSTVMMKPSEPDEILRTIERSLTGTSPAEPVANAQQFDREHLRLLTDKLALKVSELESANRRLSALTELNLQLASEHDPHVMLDKVCRGARELLGARYAVLAVREQADEELAYISTHGLAPAQAKAMQALAADASWFSQMAGNGRPRRFTTRDGAELPAQLPPLGSGLIAPIASLQRTHGWVLLGDKLGAPAFTSQDERMLSTYAAQAGRIYENGSLYKKIKQTADQLAIEVEERKRAARELSVANETLEQRVAQRTSELHDVIEGLESFNRSVSHDLRGPLGGIANAARLAQEFVAAHEPAKATHFLQVIATQADVTGQLVDSLLALARASDASLNLEAVDMNGLVNDVLASLQPPSQPPLPVAVDRLPTIHVDRKLARQVLVNLIGNALKFTGSVQRPQVHVGVSPGPGAPVFCVKDNGVGFDAHKGQQLFKPFHRLHDHRFEGSGVGLSIVKRICECHGGKVWAESTPGQGACFFFSFGDGGTRSTGA